MPGGGGRRRRRRTAVQFSSDEAQVVAEVGDGFNEVHGFDVVAGRDALIEGGEDAHAQLAGEGGLADEDPGGRGVHLAVGQRSELFELGGCQEVGLVDHDQDPPVRSGATAVRQGRGARRCMKRLTPSTIKRARWASRAAKSPWAASFRNPAQDVMSFAS